MICTIMSPNLFKIVQRIDMYLSYLWRGGFGNLLIFYVGGISTIFEIQYVEQGRGGLLTTWIF